MLQKLGLLGLSGRYLGKSVSLNISWYCRCRCQHPTHHGVGAAAILERLHDGTLSVPHVLLFLLCFPSSDGQHQGPFPARLSAGLPLRPSAHLGKSAKGSAPHWLAVIDTAASKGPSMTIHSMARGMWTVQLFTALNASRSYALGWVGACEHQAASPPDGIYALYTVVTSMATNQPPPVSEGDGCPPAPLGCMGARRLSTRPLDHCRAAKRSHQPCTW